MSNICRFTVPASRDIETIIDYIADNSSFDAAERVLSKINNKCENLANSQQGLFISIYRNLVTYFWKKIK